MNTTPNRVGIVGRDDLNWRKTADGYALHLGRSQTPLLKIVPDAVYPRMWRCCTWVACPTWST
jgi:hypothetical protein